jgi:aminoglycoside phosphotransferase (APT) family kinase protein
MSRPASTFPSRSLLQQIWSLHRLGDVYDVKFADAGGFKNTVVVNGSHVVRFNINPDKAAAGFRNEELAYSRLRRTGVPVPEAIVVDLSQRLVPYAFLISTKLEGQPVSAAWPSLPPNEREQTAYLAGWHLAHIHAEAFSSFGSLHSLSEAGFQRWYDYLAQYLEHYSQRALALELIAPEDQARLRAGLARQRPLLDGVQQAVLVHNDFQFENLLQAGGVITGIVDFEWALAGDPSWDFVAEDLWEETCPGSRQFVYEGYSRSQPLPPEHGQRLRIYKLMIHLKALCEAGRDEVQAVAARDRFFSALHGLER